MLLRRVRHSSEAHGTDPAGGAQRVEALIQRFLGNVPLGDRAYAGVYTTILHRRAISTSVTSKPLPTSNRRSLHAQCPTRAVINRFTASLRVTAIWLCPSPHHASSHSSYVPLHHQSRWREIKPPAQVALAGFSQTDLDRCPFQTRAFKSIPRTLRKIAYQDVAQSGLGAIRVNLVCRQFQRWNWESKTPEKSIEVGVEPRKTNSTWRGLCGALSK